MSNNTEVEFSTVSGRAIPATLYGVTSEYVTSLASIQDSLNRHSKHATIRIVFQDGTTSSYYSTAVSSLRTVSYIMGQIYDSTALQATSVSQCQTRTRDFLTRFGTDVDIYEIGNELNGGWVGSSQAEIDAKVTAIYNVIKQEYSSLNIRTAITLNYWPNHDYYAYAWEDTETYAQNMPLAIRNGVDFLFLSFYETAGNPVYKPTNQDFANILTKMATYFPNAKIGIGEIGAQGATDGVPDPTLAEKQRIANRYYGMHNGVKILLGANSSRYVGGYFWWYYYQDCVPYNKSESLWPTLDNNFNLY